MSDSETKKPSMELDVSVGSGETTSGSFNNGEASVDTSTSTGAGVDFNSDGTISQTGLGGLSDEDIAALEADDGDDAGEEQPGDKPDDDDQPNDDEGNTDGEEPNEGDPFDPSDEASVAAFDAKYLKPDGSGLNVEAFTPEVEANIAKGVWDVNKSTRDYLKQSIGADDALIDNYMAGMKARAEANEKAFLDVVGGKEAYATKFAWGKENFTPAQKKRFNDAMAKGGEDAREQLELLNTRYNAKNPGAAGGGDKPSARKFGLKRPASPARDATLNAGARPAAPAKTQGYANADEHRKAMNEAAGNPEKIAEVRRRLQASTWY